MIRYGKMSASFVGVLISLLAFCASIFLSNSKNGYDVDFESLPTQAQVLLDRNRGKPITPEIWAELNAILKKERWSAGTPPMLLDLKKGWFWFLLLPILGVFFYRLIFHKISSAEVFLLISPSVVALALIGF